MVIWLMSSLHFYPEQPLRAHFEKVFLGKMLFTSISRSSKHTGWNFLSIINGLFGKINYVLCEFCEHKIIGIFSEMVCNKRQSDGHNLTNLKEIAHQNPADFTLYISFLKFEPWENTRTCKQINYCIPPANFNFQCLGFP